MRDERDVRDFRWEILNTPNLTIKGTPLERYIGNRDNMELRELRSQVQELAAVLGYEWKTNSRWEKAKITKEVKKGKK